MRYIVFALMLALSGCSMPLKAGLSPALGPQAPTLGMVRAQVMALMAKTVTVGYEIDPVSGAAKPLEAKSLYATELLSVGNETYLVDLYITDALQAGHRVTESALMPMIFKNDILCAQGREALASLKAGSKL